MRVVFGPKGNTKLQPTEWTLLRLMLRVYGSAEIIRMAKWWEDDGRPWESENDWLSKEMRTPAKGFPAIRSVEPGVSVVIRAKGEPKLVEWDGRFGVVEYAPKAPEHLADLWSVRLDGGGFLLVRPEYLEVR